MFDKIYQLADKVENGKTGDLDDCARACRKTKEEVLDAKSLVASVHIELSEAWYGAAGESALSSLATFKQNRDKQAEDLETSAKSFEQVRDALEKAQLEARSKRAEAKSLETKLDNVWKEVEAGDSNTLAAWAKDKVIKAQAALLLVDLQRVVTTYDAVLLAEGVKLRNLQGEVFELAGSNKRKLAEIGALMLKEIPGLLALVKDDPDLRDAILRGDWDSLMKNPVIAQKVYDYLGFKYVEDGDYYTTGEHSLQSFLGWRDWYDDLEKGIGAELHATNGNDGDDNMEFTDPDTGKKVRLELWKGSYGWGQSFGGEVALYTRDDPPSDDLRGDFEKGDSEHFSTAQGDDQIKVTQTIYDKETKETYFTNDGEGADGDDKKHYWNLGIRSGPDVEAADLGQRATIEVRSEAMRDAMFDEMTRYAAAHPDENLEVTRDPDNPRSLSYDWKR